MTTYFDQQSERLMYRKVRESDCIAWESFFTHNPNLPFLGLNTQGNPEKQSKTWINLQLERYDAFGLGHLGVIDKKKQKLIGMCGVIPRLLEGINEFEIAYSLIPNYWNKGFGTEMAHTMIKWAIQYHQNDRYISMIHPENMGSIRVAEKNGMRYWKESNFKQMLVHVYRVDPSPAKS